MVDGLHDKPSLHNPKEVVLLLNDPDSVGRAMPLCIAAECIEQLERELAEANAAARRWWTAASPFVTPEGLREHLLAKAIESHNAATPSATQPPSVPLSEILREADHIEQNGVSLAKFGGEEIHEGRCRVLCAMYLRGFVQSYHMGEQLKALDLATATEIKSPEHVCGLQGYNPMIDPPCPGCEDRNRATERKDIK